jgi:hypothetical protein
VQWPFLLCQEKYIEMNTFLFLLNLELVKNHFKQNETKSTVKISACLEKCKIYAMGIGTVF